MRVNEEITLVAVYLPPKLNIEECKEIIKDSMETGEGEGEEEERHGRGQRKQQQQQKNKKIVIMGDLNTRLGRVTGDTIWNSRGRALHRWLWEEQGFRLQRLPATEEGGHRYTFTQGTGKSTPDHVYVNAQAWEEEDVRTFVVDEESVTFVSDHKPIGIEVEVASRQKGEREGIAEEEEEGGNRSQGLVIQTCKLRRNREKQAAYKAHCQEHFGRLLQREEEATGDEDEAQAKINAMEELINQGLRGCAMRAAGTRPKGGHGEIAFKRNQHVFLDETMKTVSRRAKEAKKRYEKAIKTQRPKREIKRNWLEYMEHMKEFRKAVRERRGQLFEAYIEKISTSSAAEQLRMLKIIKRKKGGPGANGLQADMETLRKAKEHFEQMTNARTETRPGTEAGSGTEARSRTSTRRRRRRRRDEEEESESRTGPPTNKRWCQGRLNINRIPRQLGRMLRPGSWANDNIATGSNETAAENGITDSDTAANERQREAQRQIEAQRQMNEDETFLHWTQIAGAAKWMANAKAPGKTGVVNEMYKYGDLGLFQVLEKHYKRIWRWGRIPESWKKVTIVPVPKKGDLTKVENYRPISLTESSRKIFERMIEPRIKKEIGPLDIAQGGFRENRSTLDQIACLQEWIKKEKERKNDRYCLGFLDIKSAYDSVDRPILWKKMEKKGIEKETLRVLRALFDHNKATVRIQERESEDFVQGTGLLQGSILSPLLYATFIDDLPQKLRMECSTQEMGKVDLNCLLYADDICLLADSPESLERMLERCESHAIANKYRFNGRKCEVIMTTTRSRTRTEGERKFKIDGEEIKVSQEFVYLGVNIRKEGIASGAHLLRMAEKTMGTIHLFRDLGMNHKGLPPALSAQIYKTFIRPKLEYGIGILPEGRETRQGMEMMERLQRKCMKMALSMPNQTDADLMHVLFALPTMKQRRKELGALWTCRVLLDRDVTYMIGNAHQEFKRNRGRSKKADKGSCFYSHAEGNDQRTDAIMSANRVGRVSQKERKELVLKERWKHLDEIARKTSERTGRPTIPVETKPQALKLIGTIPKGPRRKMIRWILNRIYGSCSSCGNGIRKALSRTHLERCNGESQSICTRIREALEGEETASRLGQIAHQLDRWWS